MSVLPEDARISRDTLLQEKMNSSCHSLGQERRFVQLFQSLSISGKTRNRLQHLLGAWNFQQLLAFEAYQTDITRRAAAFLWKEEEDPSGEEGQFREIGDALADTFNAGVANMFTFSWNQPLSEFHTSMRIQREQMNAGGCDAKESENRILNSYRCAVNDVLGPLCPPCIDSLVLDWQDGLVRNLARSMYEERAFDRMPILGDALEEAGCNDRSILDHCRSTQEHLCGCWVLDLVLVKR